MPDTACLHIQARDTDPVRVVDLPGGSVRIGRASYCDVRLPDAGLADEECRLRLRGGSWQIVPVAARCAVRLDGRKVSEPATLRFGESFRVGASRLTLQPSIATSPWTDQAVAEVVDLEPDEPPGTELVEARSDGRASAAVAGDRWSQARRAAKRWETRWRAAGEKLRSSAPPPPPLEPEFEPEPAPDPARAEPMPALDPPAPEPPAAELDEPAAPRPAEPPPTVADRPRRADPRRESFRRRPDLRPASPPVPPRVVPPVVVPPVAPRSTIAATPAPPARPSGYVPPVAPNARHEPVQPSGWERSPAPRRAEPPRPARVSRPEPPPAPPRPVTPPRPVGRIAPITPVVARRATIAPEAIARASAPRGAATEPRAEARREVPSSGIASVPVPVPAPAPDHDVHDAAPVVAGPSAAPELISPLTGFTRLDATEIEDGAEEENRERGPGPVIDAGSDGARGEIGPQPPEVAEGPSAEYETVQAPETETETETEPEAARPALGAARRGQRVARSAPTDAARASSTRWVAHRPIASPDEEEASGTEEARGDRSARAPGTDETDLGGVERGPGRDAERGDWRGRPSPDREWPSTPEGDRIAERDWPTVNDILAAQGVRPAATSAPRTSRRKPAAIRPEPTVARPPAQWRLPFWLAWLPGAALALGVGVLGVAGAWTWAADGYNAGVIAPRLAVAEPARKPLPGGVGPSGGSWWRTTAGHLVQWAAYVDRDGDEPGDGEEARALLDRAARLSPLNPSVRFALAHARPGETVAPELTVIRALGQSRDVPALTWAGHCLLASGKKEPALRAYRTALELAASSGVNRPAVPPFLEDAKVRRYALPAEEPLSAVIRDMAASTAWSFADWAGALPRGTSAAVVAARVLRDSGSPDAEDALDVALAEANAPAARSETTGAARAVRMAAGAEALAMNQRWAEARDRYRLAIGLMPIDVVRRAWWLNVADLSTRLDEESERQKALESAKVADQRDEITRRAVEIQKASSSFARRSGGRVSEARR